MKPLDFKESGRVQIDRSEIDRFWQHMEQYTSWTKHHGACTDRMVPLGLHGDDGQYNSAGDKLIVITVNFLLEKETQQSFGRYPLVTLREFLCEGSMLETLRPVLEILAWSFNCLFEGKHPKLNWNNEAYNGRHKAGTRIAGLHLKFEEIIDAA